MIESPDSYLFGQLIGLFFSFLTRLGRGCTQALVHAGVGTRRRWYTQALAQAGVGTRRRWYAQALVHAKKES